MGEQDELGTLFRQFRNGWNNTFETAEDGYISVCHRHVEIYTNQKALGFDVGIIEGTETHDISPGAFSGGLQVFVFQTGRRWNRVG
jgi:hypothetical protein